ncbi:MAG: FtsW/RodA/SpoVE family cell cycle protein, partial [Syntrophomonadaceae bacterium]|nr:FtsW/RodA/SpoVE family cell cycle protein [Syntrophomonadaceae bacterium]
GMSLGIMPITGIPLPFLSYGGSAMLTNLIAAGLILSVNVRGKKLVF